MIYSETFSQGLEREKERLHQFTPIDDNFAPVETEVDFVPRYIKDDERASWMSEGSILDTTTTSNYNHKKNLSTFSDECSEANPDHDRRQIRWRDFPETILIIQTWPKSVTMSCLLIRCHAFGPAQYRGFLKIGTLCFELSHSIELSTLQQTSK